MDDPFGSLVAFCNCSSSQEDLLERSLFAREDELSPECNPPEPYDPSQSPAAAAVDGSGIVICSPPETQSSKAAAASTPSAEEFKTPPEESRCSSSEEPPPPPQFDGPGIDGGRGTPDLGLLQEGKRKPKMVELLPDGKVLVEEVPEIDLEAFRVGQKRKAAKQSPIGELSPSKRFRVSGEASGLPATPILETEEVVIMSGVATPVLETEEVVIMSSEKVKKTTPLNSVAGSKSKVGNGKDEGDSLAKRKLEFPMEMEAKDDTEEIEEYEEEEENCAISREIFPAQSIQQEDKGKGDQNNVEDQNRQGRRELPAWAYQQEDNREGVENENWKAESRFNRRTVDDQMGALLHVLALLAKEVRRYHNKDNVDIIETAKRRGMTFPEPKWWHDDDDEDGN